MSNRIGGDFNYETIEAFRAAYAQQIFSPEEETVANNSGLPTNTIGNTSPWFDGVGLWKYPSGKGPEDDLKAPFDPNNYISEEDGELYLEDIIDNIIDEVFDALEEDSEETEE